MIDAFSHAESSDSEDEMEHGEEPDKNQQSESEPVFDIHGKRISKDYNKFSEDSDPKAVPELDTSATSWKQAWMTVKQK